MALPKCGHTARMKMFLLQILGRRALLLALYFCAGVCAAPASFAADAPEAYTARVTQVWDGDTLWVRPSAGGRSRKLRLDGIDAPEICQEGGVAARDALRARLLKQTVTVRERAIDVYGRPLATLRLGDDDMAQWMVTEGWAWSYRWHGDPGPFPEQEAKARALQRGIFRETGAQEPREFRRSHGPCVRAASVR